MSTAAGLGSRSSLLNVADLFRGVTYKKDEARTEPAPGLLPVLRATNLQNGRLVLDDLVYVPSTRVSDVQRIRKGDIVIAMSSGSREVVGKAALVTSDWEGGFGAFCGVLRAKSGTSPELLSHFLQSPVYRAAIEQVATGTNINNLSKTTLAAIDVPLPRPEAQEQLGRLLSELDGCRRSSSGHLSIAARAIDHFRHAVLAAACSGRLTADWRESNPSSPVGQRPALSGPALANTSGSPNTDELVDVPDTWGWWPVESVTEKVIDYRGRTPPHDSSGPIPHVRTTQIRDGRLDWATDRFVTEEVYEKYMTRGTPHSGDVLFTMEAPMGEVGIVDRDEPFSIAQRILLMRPGDHISGEFLALALRSLHVRRAIEYRATGSGVLGVSYKRLRSVLLPIPPLDEQVAIAERVGQLLKLADSLNGRIEVASKQMDRSSQAILAKAFRGDLASSHIAGST